jgi:N(6)-adenine-specific DNA methyltransferase
VLLPPHSTFLLSDIKSGLRPLLSKYKNKFQCIVIDPPWENRSVKRAATGGGGGGNGDGGSYDFKNNEDFAAAAASSSSYQMLPNRTLLSLPIADLGAPGCLVALWVTNREKLRKFIEHELLIKWKVRHAATWHWLKVAQDGRPVTPLVGKE